jgi:hypothetical protein
MDLTTDIETQTEGQMEIIEGEEARWVGGLVERQKNKQTDGQTGCFGHRNGKEGH